MSTYRFLIYVTERNDVYIKYCDKRKCIRGKQKNSTTKIQEKQKNEESIHNQLVHVQISIHPSNPQNPKKQNLNLRQHPMSQTRTQTIVISSTESPITKKSFEELFLEAVDEAFSFLGNSCKKAIYSRLEGVFKINRRDIPYKIDRFIEAIDTIFGDGAKFLEILIMRSIYKRVRPLVSYPGTEDFSFCKYITSIREQL